MEVEQTAPANAEDKGKGKAGPVKRFEIKKWNAVAMWSWAICTDTCAICRNNLYEPSIEYQVCSCLTTYLTHTMLREDAISCWLAAMTGPQCSPLVKRLATWCLHRPIPQATRITRD